MAEADTTAADKASTIEAAMVADGVRTTDRVQEDYWGVDVQDTFFFPDHTTFVTLQQLNEGGRLKYQKAIGRDVRLNRVSGDATLRMSGGEERYELLRLVIVGWNLQRQGKPVPFSSGSPGSTLEQWLNVAPTSIIDAIEKAARKLNPWLTSEMTVEAIDEQIEELRKLRDEKEREEEGNASS